MGAPKVVSKAEGDDEDTDLELPAPEDTDSTEDAEGDDEDTDRENGELIEDHDFSTGWPAWKDDKCQHSYQCKSNCCAWAHSNVCMNARTWMGRFNCIA